MENTKKKKVGQFQAYELNGFRLHVYNSNDYLTEHPDCSVKQVVFNVFKDIDRDIYQRLL